MIRRNISKRLIPHIIFGLTVVLLITLVAVYLFVRQPHKKAAVLFAPPLSNTSSKTNLVVPTKLQIPKLKIDASVEEMGITIHGLLEAPAGPKKVGWYKYGPLPGEIGSAVIDGHYGRMANGEDSVFDNLNTLHKGDTLVVLNSAGAATTFVVRELKTFSPESDDTSMFRSNDGKSHLNLITCDGSWNNNTRSYSKRLVVFTDKQ